MIILRFRGQLGNQMFEYATALALSKKYNVDLNLYDFDYKTYLMKQGNKIERLSAPYLKRKSPCILYLDTIKKIASIIFGTEYKCVLKDKKYKYHFINDPMNNGTPCFSELEILTSFRYNILDGYFQSPKFFERYREELLKHFTPNFELSKETKELLQRIENDDYSTSIHVRRGDYVKAGMAINNDYYQKAISLMIKKNSSTSFYVFSDDINWAKENICLYGKKVLYVQREKKVEPFEDIWLMSKCKNNIIANSTFSWWGAYLNQNDKKIIIAPQKLRENNLDIIPEDWVVI